MSTRRTFLSFSALSMLRPLAAVAQILPAAPTTRPKIAEIDHDRILAAANRALAESPKPSKDPQSPEYLAFTLAIPALAAAAQIDPENAVKYSGQAGAYLQAWLLEPETRLPTTPAYAAFEGVTNRSALAEMAVALPFLALEPGQLAEVKLWFAEYLEWLTTNRTALLARDAKNHHGSSWLLQAAAFARLAGNDTLVTELRHRFKTVTLRAQIEATGFFPHELPTENPFRDSLFNLDLLAGACVLMTTRFESPWDYELQDGPGMRAAIARFAPYIANRAKWPYPADLTHFKLLPGRRPALVFAGRAYQQADYVTLWRTLDPDPTDPETLRAFPIRQPLLWLSQARPQVSG